MHKVLVGNAASWLRLSPAGGSIELIVTSSLPEEEFDTGAVTDEYRAEIDGILPSGYSLVGEEVHRLADSVDPDDVRETVAEEAGMIDFYKIVMRHDRSIT